MFRASFIPTLLAVSLVVPCSHASAAPPNDSPYARSRETGWPPFYKPLKVAPRDQVYYAMGWCRTNHYHYKSSDLVDIDRLPEVNYNGELVDSQELGFAMRMAGTSEPIAVHVHPEVTRVHVRGDVRVASLKPGAIVRFEGVVDRRGHVVEPVAHLELCAASADNKPQPVKPGVEGSVTGKLLRSDGDQLFLGVKTGQVRAVNLETTSDCKVTTDADDFRLAWPGSQAHVRGRIYRADDRIPVDQVFATEIELRLSR